MTLQSYVIITYIIVLFSTISENIKHQFHVPVQLAFTEEVEL